MMTSDIAKRRTSLFSYGALSFISLCIQTLLFYYDKQHAGRDEEQLSADMKDIQDKAEQMQQL